MVRGEGQGPERGLLPTDGRLGFGRGLALPWGGTLPA